MSDFKRLRVWQLAHQLTLDIYRRTAAFPEHERFGLVSQMRRCASSIGANIAESTGRPTIPDQRRFLVVALGSARELESHIILSGDLGFHRSADAVRDLDAVRQVQRMLCVLVDIGRKP